MYSIEWVWFDKWVIIMHSIMTEYVLPKDTLEPIILLFCLSVLRGSKCIRTTVQIFGTLKSVLC